MSPQDVLLVGQPENDPETADTPVVEPIPLVVLVAEEERDKCFQLFAPNVAKILKYHLTLAAIDQYTAQTATELKELKSCP